MVCSICSPFLLPAWVMKGLYLKWSWYYWQPLTTKVGGKRPGAISLRTKDIVEATRLAVDLSQKATLENRLSRHS